MKGYINKRAKIKYETTPSAPEITGDYVKDITKNEIGLGDLKGVTVTNNPVSNSVIVYESSVVGWKNRKIDTPQWVEVTIDDIGGDAVKRIDLSENGKFRVLAVYVNVTLLAGTAAGNFGAVFEFTDGTRKAMGEMPNAIKTDGTSYVNIDYGSKNPEGLATGSGTPKRLYTGTISTPSTAVTTPAALNRRLDGFYLAGHYIKFMELRTQTSGLVIPAGSSAEIKILRI